MLLVFKFLSKGTVHRFDLSRVSCIGIRFNGIMVLVSSIPLDATIDLMV